MSFKGVRTYITIIFVSISFVSFSQELPRIKRLKIYKQNLAEYIPSDLKDSGVLAIRLTNTEVVSRFRDAHYQALAKAGLDTSNITSPFHEVELEHFAAIQKKGKNILAMRDKKLIKILRATYVGTNELGAYDISKYRYLLDIDFESTKKTLDQLGFVVSYGYFVIDRLTGKKYRAVHEKGISLVDLIDR